MSWLGFPCKIEKQTKQLHALKNKQNSCAGSVRRQETGRASRRPSVKRGEDREGRARLRMKVALAAENRGRGRCVLPRGPAGAQDRHWATSAAGSVSGPRSALRI